MKNGLVVDEDGNKFWYKDDEYHREDGPAIEWKDGTKYWYRNGRLHREDGPAAEFNNGGKRWSYKGIFAGNGDKPNPALWARLTSFEANGGPLLNGCIVAADGDKHWFKDDKIHREDGPAVEEAGGRTVWCLQNEILGWRVEGFWKLWDRLTPEQRGNPNLLKHLPR